MSRFRYMCDGIQDYPVKKEIAYQLKRIAEVLEEYLPEIAKKKK